MEKTVTLSRANWLCYLLIAIISSGLLSFTGCGGGGGDGDGGGDPTGLTYSGSQSQATLVSGNVQELSRSAFEGGQFGSTMGGGFASLSSDSQLGGNEHTLIGTLRVFQSAADQVNFDVQPSYTAQVLSESETIAGGCGGTATYSINVNDATGEFSGSMTFNAYCEGSTQFSGSTDFWGSLDESHNAEEFDFSFNMLSVTAEGMSYTMDGELSMDLTSTPILVSMEMLIEDGAGNIIWVNNYVWSITEEAGYDSVEITGRFYHPDYGYVDLITEEPLIVDYDQRWPRSGILVLQGKNSTEAKLIAHSQDICEVTADFDGDGIHEYSSGTIPWEDL